MDLAAQKERAVAFVLQMNAPDPAVLTELIADDFEFEFMMRTPGVKVQKHDEFLKWFPKIMKSWFPNGLNMKVHTIVAEGPHVAIQAEADTIGREREALRESLPFLYPLGGRPDRPGARVQRHQPRARDVFPGCTRESSELIDHADAGVLEARHLIDRSEGLLQRDRVGDQLARRQLAALHHFELGARAAGVFRRFRSAGVAQMAKCLSGPTRWTWRGCRKLARSCAKFHFELGAMRRCSFQHPGCLHWRHPRVTPFSTTNARYPPGRRVFALA